jgi:hypothetical protein
MIQADLAYLQDRRQTPTARDDLWDRHGNGRADKTDHREPWLGAGEVFAQRTGVIVSPFGGTNDAC